MADIAKQMASMLPAADEDTRSTNEYLGKSEDEWNPLQFAQESWASAKDRFMNAGVTEVDANDPAIYNAYLRSVDYLKDTGLAGLDLVDAGVKAAIGTVGELATSDDQTQKRFQRDIYSMPDAFAGMAGTKSISQLDDAIESAVGTGVQAVEKAKDVGYTAYQKAPPVVGDIVGQTKAILSGDKAFGMTSDVGPRPLSAFGGIGMEGAAKDKNLKKAIKLANKAGVPNIGEIPEDLNLEIWKKTGWFVDPNDGQWRLYFSDYKSEILPFKDVFKTETVDFDTLKKYPLDRKEGKRTVLSNVLLHDDLFKRYPDFKNADVNFFNDPTKPRNAGYANYKDGEVGEIGINLAAFDSFDSIRGTILHEVQHLIQNKEGFVKGANSANIPQNLVDDYSKAIAEKVKPLQDKVDDLRKQFNNTEDQVERKKLYSEIDTLQNKIYSYKMQDFNSEYDFYRGAGGEIEARLTDNLKDVEDAENYYPLGYRENLVNMEGLSPDFIGSKGVDPLVYTQQDRRVPEKPTGFIQRAKDALNLNEESANIVPQMSNEEYDTLFKALDEADNPVAWQKGAKAIIKKGRVANPGIKTPELEDSTRLLLENKITREEHLANVDKYKPVNAWDALPREPSDKALVFALDAGKRDNGLFVLDAATAEALGVPQSSLSVGMKFNGRLDIPAYLHNDTWIVAGTSPSVKTADNRGVTNYAKAIHYVSDGDKPVQFVASEKSSASIGSGEKDKWGYATVSGIVGDLDANAIRAKAEQYLNDPEWTQVGFDPRRQGGFYVRAGENKHVPVREASEVIQIGPLVLARNAKLDFDYKGYSEGGMAMNEQMNAVFKSTRGYAEGGEVDPVSGNEVPTGSLPEEVRDDIPAQLSEGEYVVPADVVRYYGVKFFEDLRGQAKMGWQQMEQNGRIGGEPVMPDGMEMGDEEFPFSLEELQVVDSGEEQPQMARGGFISGYELGGDVAAIAKEFPGTIVGSGAPSEEYKTYTNAQGMTITIRFVNGKPVTPIPPGYNAVSSAQEAVAPKLETGDDNQEPTTVKQPEAVDWEKADPAKFREVLDTQFGKLGKATNALVGAVNPLIGAGVSIASTMQNKAMLDALDKRLAVADPNSTEYNELSSVRKDLLSNVDRNNDGKVDNIVERSGIFGGESSWDKNLKDTDGTKGASFGDTWLGDLLGFDEKGAGVQGAGLMASTKGARRENSNYSENQGVVGSNDTGKNSLLQSAANFFTPDDGKSYQGGKLVEDKPKDDKDKKD